MTDKTEHSQAYLLRWIADGEVIEACHVTDDNWKYRNTYQILTDLGEGTGYKKYRIKPKTIRIGNYDVAEPMKENASHDSVYSIDFSGPIGVYKAPYGSDTYKHIMDSGVFWYYKEDAELAAKAIKELLTGTEC